MVASYYEAYLEQPSLLGRRPVGAFGGLLSGILRDYAFRRRRTSPDAAGTPGNSLVVCRATSANANASVVRQ